MRFGIRFLVVAGLAAGLSACGGDPGSVGPAGPEFTAAGKPSASGGVLEQINAKLAAQGKAVRALKLEYITSAESGEIGQTVYAKNVGNKQLDSHWVPGDPEREGRTDITYAIDQVDAPTTSGLTATATTEAISRAMGTWQDATCSTIPLERVPDLGIDLGLVQWLEGYGGVPGWLADITHAGWLPWAFFSAIAPPNGGDFILGVTFTFVWIDENFNPTDIDGNGKDDVAFQEIYYNDQFSWAIDGTVDVESIALHEVGHGLSQGHFGKVFSTNKNGKLHFAPRAVMNAVYFGGVEQVLKGTDNGGHCSIWGSWPNN